jgi:hypothetical protein
MVFVSLAQRIFHEAEFRVVAIVFVQLARHRMILGDPSFVGQKPQDRESAAFGDDGVFALAVLADNQVVRRPCAPMLAAGSASAVSAPAVLRTLPSHATSLFRGIEVVSVMKFSFSFLVVFRARRIGPGE